MAARWAAVQLPTAPKGRRRTLAITPREGDGTMAPATVGRGATGLTPKPERAVAREDPREKELKHFVETSIAVRDGREAALDDWIDLYLSLIHI